MRLTGTWRGEYTYGPDYEAIADRSVPFTMSLTEAGLAALVGRARVVGYVRDDATRGGMPEKGRIAGRRRGAALTFVKSMPVGYLTDPDGALVPLSEALSRQGHEGVRLDGSHRIEYQGTISSDGQTLSGTWRILPTRLTSPRGEMLLQGVGTGTWTARRANDLPSEV